MDAATQRALAEIPAPRPDGAAGTALRAYLAVQARAFLRHRAEGGLLLAACVRTRSALDACASMIEDGDWAAALRASVSGVAELLGAERDADAVRPRVLEPLDRWVASGAYADGGAARARTLLTRMLDRERSSAHGAATAALVAPSFHALADRMATLARDVPLNSVADSMCSAVLPGVFSGPFQRLVSLVGALPDPLLADDAGLDSQWFDALGAGEAALHTAELCRPVGLEISGRPVGSLIASLELVVAALRDQQEAVLAAGSVHRAADTPRIAAATGYVLGRLHAEERMAVLRSRCAAPWGELAVSGSVSGSGSGPGAAAGATETSSSERLVP